jgi:hypothetical protein
MSGQHHYSPPRAELIGAMQGKTMPALAKKGGLVVGALGMILFVIGAATGEARAWQAFLVNWLFFTTIASAAVMFAAVHHHGAMVARRDPIPRGVRGVPADRGGGAADHHLRRSRAHLSLVGPGRHR